MILGACCLVAIVALVAFVRGGPVPALTGLFLALLPVPVVLAVILYLDRLEPEPRALLAAMFGAGAGIAALTALLGHALDTGVITVPELGPPRTNATSATMATRQQAPSTRRKASGVRPNRRVSRTGRGGGAAMPAA